MTDYLSLLNSQCSAYSKPLLSAVIRCSPEDFYVDECLGFKPEGEGEHVFLYIEKVAANTQFVAEQLAVFAKVSLKDVSFSGMKDRWAVTRQWFSVHLPGKASPLFSALNNSEFNVLKQSRHPRKLRRGVHRSNFFRIRLQQLKGDRTGFRERAEMLATYGVPNYFGEQRFGFGARNISSAERWFTGAFKPRRKQKGIFLSAARAFLFNQLLSKRIENQTWLEYMDSEIMMLAGSHSVFKPSLINETIGSIAARIKTGDIHCTGPLYGKSSTLCCADRAAQFESEILHNYPDLLTGLIKQGLTAQRRALRVIPEKLTYQFIDDDCLELSFTLASGSFATAVIKELVCYQSAEHIK